MSLRSYTALTKERDELAASLAAAQSKPAPAPAVVVAAPTRPVATAPAPVSTPSVASATEPRRLAAEPVAAAPARTHTIASGDTLTKISLRYYGNANRWPDILAANRDVLRTERDLVVGRVLRIP
jgi:nucleoid-associated protein YgaU